MVSWNDVQSAINALSTTVVAIATVVLVRKTARYVKLTQSLVHEAEQNRRPSVAVDLEFPNSHDCSLVVRNCGTAAARNVKFTLVESRIPFMIGQGNSGLGDLNVFKSGISILVPDRVLKFRLPYIDERAFRTESGILRLHISYVDVDEKQIDEDVVLDLAAYRDVLFSSFRDPAHAIAEAIRDTASRADTRDRVSTLFSPPKKTCPVCAEQIHKNAKKCPSCLEWLPESVGEKLANEVIHKSSGNGEPQKPQVEDMIKPTAAQVPTTTTLPHDESSAAAHATKVGIDPDVEGNSDQVKKVG